MAFAKGIPPLIDGTQGFTRRYLPHAVVLSAYVLLGVRFFGLINRFAVNLFTWDQWGFNDATLFQQHSLWQIFRWQWGPHRLGIAGILSKILEPLGSWNSRYEAFGIGVVIFIASALALFLKKRLFGSIGYQDVIIPLIFLTPAQYETLIAAEGPAPFAFPLLLAVVYCISWTLDSWAWKYVCVLLANIFLIYTGYGIFMGIVTPMLVLCDCGRNRRSGPRNHRVIWGAPLLVSIGSLLSFFVGYLRLPTMGCSPQLTNHQLNYFWFIDVMFASFAGVKASRNLAPAILLGGIMLVSALLALLFFMRRLFVEETSRWKIGAIPFALSSYSVLFALTAAIGRLCLGLGMAESSRYVTPLVLGFLGLYFGALSMRSTPWRRIYMSLLWTVALLGPLRINTIDYAAINEYSSGKRAWKECYLTIHNVQQCDAQSHFYVIPRLDHTFIDENRLQGKLDFLERNRLNLFSE